MARPDLNTPEGLDAYRAELRGVAKPVRQAAFALVIIGAAGDLTRRLVVPALYNLSRTRVLPEQFALIGVDLVAGTTQSWRNDLRDTLNSFVGRDAAEFEVDHVDPASGQGWNVTVRGECVRVNDPKALELVAAAGLSAPWAGGDRRLVVKIVIHDIDGVDRNTINEVMEQMFSNEYAQAIIVP